MANAVLLRQILPKYKELREAGKVSVERDGEQLKITAKRYAQDTGEEVDPLVLTPTKSGLEQHKAQLQEELDLVAEVMEGFTR